jgi:hypothetical protein
LPKPYNIYSSATEDPTLHTYRSENDPGWMYGAQLTDGRKKRTAVASMDNPQNSDFYNASQKLKGAINNSGLDFSKIPFSKRNTKKSATFAKSLYPTKDKYDNTEKIVAKSVNPSKNTNKYFK